MTLYLFPNLLWKGGDQQDFLPAPVFDAVNKIDGLIAESDGGGRRFLSRFRDDARVVPIALLRESLDFLLEPLLEGQSWGVVSDAGLPCVADPGSQLVAKARKRGVEIQAFSGPCSITLALMLSGLHGQNFCFHGYIAKDPQKREQELQQWEEQEGVQIFIEAPHRNQHTLESCIKVLNPSTLLSVASNLTAPDQLVETKPIEQWQLLNLNKQPTIFLFHGNSRDRTTSRSR